MSDLPKGIEAVAEIAAEMARRKVMEDFKSNKHGDSPIECILYGALEIVAKMQTDFVSLRSMGESKNETIDNGHKYIWVERQSRISEYRVDFLIAVIDNNGKQRSLVVECDGHDFHERTKKQATSDKWRDRRIQDLGFKIYRFSGSEIYNDPFDCATTIFEWAFHASGKKREVAA